MIVKVEVYGYATSTFNYRKIARKFHEDIAFLVLAASNLPVHRTIRGFCALHLSEFTKLFEQVVRMARELGLGKLGAIAVDGTKVKVNASRHKAMSYTRMQSAEGELNCQIEAFVQKAASADETVKSLPALDLPADSPQARLPCVYCSGQGPSRVTPVSA